MNQNNHNQVPMQNALMNALMGYMQPQAQAQQGSAPMQTFPPFQQQQPVLWAGWQPQGNVAMPGGTQYVQQWASQPMVQQQRPAAAPVPQSASVNEIAAAVAAAVQPLLQDKNDSPVGSKPDDEKILIEALKKAKADGLTPLQALKKLHSVNDHTETGWKNYFLDHVERLYPKVYRDVRPLSVPYVEVPQHSSTSRNHAGSSSTSARKDRSRSPPRHNPPPIPRFRARSPELPPSLSRQRSTNNATPPRSHAARENRGPQVPSSPSSARSKRGDPVADFHAGTHIPPLAVYSKPKVPPRNPGSKRFTDDDKIFFIHYLRWRLRREGPIPTRSVLYAELAEQTPHRDAEAWKRHWDDHPQLPDRILIEARNREWPDSQTAPTAPAPDGPSDEEGEEDEDGEGEGEADEEEAEDRHAGHPADRPSAGDAPNSGKGKTTRKHIVRLRVTESDLRAMAKYMAEKEAVWDSYPSQCACWEEFARNNTKRSYSAWINVTIRKAKVIEKYKQEYLQENQEEVKPRPSPTAPLNPPTTGSSASHSQAAESRNAEGRVDTSQKRSVDTRPAERHSFPAQKRVKREPPEYIDLTSD
ncbi:hypothetical protein C8T65DRAFT_636020 [Cerioporus squamosus]|nr:hypothetical protein C8T65DRAFT_636020 [Cerioporus squamosus]